MFCGNCGKEISDDSKFCPNCGVATASISSGHKRRADLAAANGRAKRLVVLLLILAGAVWLLIQNVGQKAAGDFVASVVHAPIDLKDEIENITASSWRAIPLQLPYIGTLALSVVTALKAEREITHYPEFYAAKTKIYRRSGRLTEGLYYLVLKDSTLGILSSASSDVAIRARLEP